MKRRLIVGTILVLALLIAPARGPASYCPDTACCGCRDGECIEVGCCAGWDECYEVEMCFMGDCWDTCNMEVPCLWA